MSITLTKTWPHKKHRPSKMNCTVTVCAFSSKDVLNKSPNKASHDEHQWQDGQICIHNV